MKNNQRRSSRERFLFRLFLLVLNKINQIEYKNMFSINLKQLTFTLIRLIKFEKKKVEKKVAIELKYTAFGKKAFEMLISKAFVYSII